MVFDDMMTEQIVLQRELPRILAVTQEWFDTLSTKDPKTVYIILGSKDRRVYHGEVLVSQEFRKPEYFLSTNESQIAIYVNFRENYTDRLVKIADYSDIDVAIKDLVRFNTVGAHGKWALQCYNITLRYLLKEISLQDLMIGIMTVFGFGKEPVLQALIDYCLSLGLDPKSFEPNMEVAANLPHIKHRHPVFRMYSDLYDVLVLFDFFKDPKYHEFDKKINLSDFIQKLPAIFLHTNSMIGTPLNG